MPHSSSNFAATGSTAVADKPRDAVWLASGVYQQEISFSIRSAIYTVTTKR